MLNQKTSSDAQRKLPKATKWYSVQSCVQVSLIKSNWVQLSLRRIETNQVRPSGTRRSQMKQGKSSETKCNTVRSSDSGRNQVTPGDNQWRQIKPNKTKGNQVLLCEARQWASFAKVMSVDVAVGSAVVSSCECKWVYTSPSESRRVQVKPTEASVSKWMPAVRNEKHSCPQFSYKTLVVLISMSKDLFKCCQSLDASISLWSF